MDNVIDNTFYPLKAQEIEAKNKRRMGLGITGLANVCELLRFPYGSENMILFMKNLLTTLRNIAYITSAQIAYEKGPFPAYSPEYLNGEFIQTLPKNVQDLIRLHGIRNSHLLSIAPTGTISLFAGNISSGIEPPFSLKYKRRTIMPDNSIHWWDVYDYAYDMWDVKGKTSNELTAKEHINVLVEASKLVDSACSKTCNVGDNVSFEDFKTLYLDAYYGGASGCTTFRPASIETRGEVMKAMPEVSEGEACFIDPVTGERTCSD
jgi:ribonucleoside-diphosphate reductase alpha chain